MPSTSLIILLILNLALPVFGLSCYHHTEYDNTQTVRHNMSFCTAIYHVANRQGTFFGADRDPIKTEKLKWDYNLGKECQIQKTLNHENGEYEVTYNCLCFSSMCNFPFSYEEFKNRGFSLAPQPSKVDSVW